MKKISLIFSSLLVLFLFYSIYAPTVQAQGPAAEDCDDGADNDGNGKIDCDDHAACNKDPVCDTSAAPDVCHGNSIPVNINTFDCDQPSFACCKEPRNMCDPQTGECSPICRGQTTLTTACDGLVYCCPEAAPAF